MDAVKNFKPPLEEDGRSGDPLNIDLNAENALKVPEEENQNNLKSPSDMASDIQSLNEMILTSKYIPDSVDKFGGMKKWNRAYIKKLYDMT